jgi:hypothetical protein
MTVTGPSLRPASISRSDLIGLVVAALLLSGLVAGWWFTMVATEPSAAPSAADGKRLAAIYDPPTSAIENAFDRGDGQLFAAMSTDPLAQRSEIVRGGDEERAYRYQRPMYGWLGWAASGGQAGAVAWALVAVTVASCALLVVAGARFLVGSGVDPRWGLALLFAPGVAVNVTWIGPEVLATALALFGLDAWRRHRDGPVPLAAIALFAAAGLARESFLLFPAILVLVELGHRNWRRAFVVASSAIPYFLWVGYLSVAIGALPRGSVGGRLSVLPFGGALQAASAWTATDLVIVGITVALALGGLWVERRTYLGALIAAHLLLAGSMGEIVWARSVGYTRVLLPLWALSLVAVIPALVASRSARSEAVTEAVAGAVALDRPRTPSVDLGSPALVGSD